MENHNYEKSILTAGAGVPGSLWIHPFIRVPFLSQYLAWRGLCEPAGGALW